MLVDYLPPESATIAAVRAGLPDEDLEERSESSDPEAGRWSVAEMLLASVVDELRRFEHIYVSAHVKQGQAGLMPEPIPRPGMTRAAKKVRRSRLTDEQRAILDPRLRLVQDDEAG